MHMFANAPYTALAPLMEWLFVAFGPRRLPYGSNYQIMHNEAVYSLELDMLKTCKLGVPPESVEQVCMGTAMNLWFDERP